MNERSEPTTGEIVRALRCVADDTECKDCRYKYPVGNVLLCDHEQMNGNAADRLESQAKENEISRHLIEMQSNVITELTARAEQAEAQRDEAWDALDKRCEECFYSYDPKDETCIECAIGVWRGLPQEGEGK